MRSSNPLALCVLALLYAVLSTGCGGDTIPVPRPADDEVLVVNGREADECSCAVAIPVAGTTCESCSIKQSECMCQFRWTSSQ